jgi:hypothetical protein
MLAKISKTDAQWLLNEYGPKRGYRVDNSTFQMFLKAYNLMKGTDRKVNCFTCEGRAIAAMASSMYEQYESKIQKIANARKRKTKK